MIEGMSQAEPGSWPPVDAGSDEDFQANRKARRKRRATSHESVVAVRRKQPRGKFKNPLWPRARLGDLRPEVTRWWIRGRGLKLSCHYGVSSTLYRDHERYKAAPLPRGSSYDEVLRSVTEGEEELSRVDRAVSAKARVRIDVAGPVARDFLVRILFCRKNHASRLRFTVLGMWRVDVKNKDKVVSAYLRALTKANLVMTRPGTSPKTGRTETVAFLTPRGLELFEA